MAEIPKFKGTPVYNQPIGVVQPMRDTSGEAFQRIGQALFEHDYAKVYAAEETKGKAFGAAAAFGKAKDGGLGPIEIPETFSKVARQNALPVGDKRYIERLTLDAQMHANELHANHDNKKDYVGFQAKWKAYSEDTLKRLSSDPSLSKYAASIASALDAEGFAHGKKLYADRLGVEHKQAFVNRVQILESNIKNQRAFVNLQSKDYEELPDGEESLVAQADSHRNNILEIIDGLEEEFPTLVEREMLQTLRDNIDTEHFLGKLDNVASTLIQGIGDNFNPYTSDIPIGNIMKSAQTAIRTGNMDNITNETHRKILDEIGLSEIISTSGFGDVRDKLASAFDSVENNIVAQAKENKDGLLRSAYANMAAQGVPMSANASGHILKTGAYAIGTPQDLLNKLPTILMGDRNAPEYQVLMGNGQLPDFVIKAFSPDIMEGYLAQNSDNPMALITMRNFFKQATHRMRDGRLDINQRGFSDDTFMMFETMDAVANTHLFKDFTPADLLAKQAQLDRDPDAKELVKTRVGNFMKVDGKQPSTLDFVRDATGSTDAGVNLHFTRYADALIYTFGAAEAASIIANSVEKVFKKSDYMFMQGGQKNFTRMAPEQHFRGDGEMDIILEAAQAKLQLSPKGSRLKIGSTAFFAPTTGTAPIKNVPTNLPSYRLVDRNGQVLLDANSQPLVVGPQDVIQARDFKTKEQIEKYVSKAEAARARHLSGTNQIGQFKPRSSGGAASSLFSSSKAINELLDAQRQRIEDKVAGQK